MGEGVSYTVKWSSAASKVLRKLPQRVSQRLVKAADRLAVNPRPRGCIRLEGKSGQYRIREGDYRLIYEVRDDILVVLIVKVGDRKDVYRE
jgi:mRNA interferase RelE/StbE